MNRSTLRRAALAMVAIAALAACGGSESATTDDTTAASAATTSEPTATESATTEPTATEPVSTDPAPTDAPTTSAASSTTVAEVDAPAATLDGLIGSGAPINLAHAGGDQSFPHSTMFAFRSAVEAGADALEMDVQLTGDGVLIVQHDDTVDKTTNTTGPVGALTLDQLQALDNAYWFSPQCWPCQDRPVEEYLYRGVRTGEAPPPAGSTADDFRIETFRSIAEAFPDMVLDIEIKGTFPDALPVAEQLAAEIEELGRTDSVVVVSFDDALLDAFHELAPNVALSPGLGRLTDWFLNGAEVEPYFTVFQVPPFQGDIQVVSPETVQRVHDEGRTVWVWADDAATQENTAFYQSMLDMGVDGIITGRPGDMPD